MQIARDPWTWAFWLIFPAWILIAWLNGDCSGESKNCEAIDGVGVVCEEPDPPDYRDQP